MKIDVRVSSDLRKLVRSTGLATVELKKIVKQTFKDELKKIKRQLKEDVRDIDTTDTTLRGRSRKLSRTVDATFEEREFSFVGRIGFLKATGRDLAKIATNVTGLEDASLARPVIRRPVHAKKLAFPHPHAPRDIVTRSGEQLMTAREASRTYKLVYTPNLIYGYKRKPGSIDFDEPQTRTKRRRKMPKHKMRVLFIRRSSVRIKKRIALGKYNKMFQRNLEAKVREVLNI